MVMALLVAEVETAEVETGDDNAFVQHPTTQQITYTQVDDGCSGHWAFSFPPRCLGS